MNLSQSQVGFFKAILVVVIVSICSFLENQANLTGVVNPVIATLVAALAASAESYFKGQSSNTTAFFGAVSMD